MQPSRPLRVGIAFSLAVHVLLLAWLWSLELGPRWTFEEPLSEEPEGAPVVFFTALPREEGKSAPSAPKSSDGPTGGRRASRTQAAPASPPSPEGLLPGTGPSSASRSDAAPQMPSPTGSATTDIPRQPGGPLPGGGLLTLTPRFGVVVDSGLEGLPTPTARSRLSHPSLEIMRRSLPSELTEQANQTEALQTAEARARGMLHSLKANASGQVRAPPSGNRADTPIELKAAVPEQVGPEDLRRAMNSLKALRSFSEGAATSTWSLQLEVIKQGRDLQVSLAKASTFPALDVLVQQRTRLWMGERKRREPDFMEGIRRALWQVDAYVHFRQGGSDVKLEDLTGAVATGAITGLGKGPLNSQSRQESWATRGLGLALTLNVDETTGKTEVINLGSPQYRLELRLLESELDVSDAGVGG